MPRQREGDQDSRSSERSGIPRNPRILQIGARMTGDDLRTIRKRLGLSLHDWGLALGYSGPHTRQQVHKIEVGIAPLTERTARLARMYELFGIPDEFKAAARAAAPRPAGRK